MRILIFTIVALFLASSAYADTVKFSWEPNTESTLAGYNVYCGATSRNYTESYDAYLPDTIDGRVNYEIEIASGTWYCAATAYDIYNEESDYSNEAISQSIGNPIDFKKERK